MALVYFLPFLAHLLLSANTIHGFFDNMTIWTANDGFMYSSQTNSWLSGNMLPTSTHVSFNDARKQLKGVACHVAWKYLIFSDTGTQTLLLVLPSLNAVYAYTGTSPKIGHVAVDWLSNNMYWADGGFGWIGLQALKSNPGQMATNGRLKVIVSSLLDQPQGLAVLPLQRRIFWTDSGSSPKIESADLLGGNRRVLVWQGVSKPTAISVDTESTRLYWVDEFKETIESCDMVGVNRRLLTYLKGSVMGGLQVFEKYIIVTEREKSHIRAINKETGIDAANAIQNASDPRDVAVFSSSLQPRENATCDSLSCEHICIQNENGGTCVCSSGYQLAQDGRSCAQSVTSLWKNFVLSTESKVCSVPVNLLYSHPYIYNISQVISCFINGSNIQHLAVNSHNATLYYATRTSIHLYNTQTGNDIILFTGSKEIGGLAYDTVSGTLMWSEPDRIVGLLPNKSQFPVYGNLQNPRHITLYSRLGQIFWTERNSSSYFTTVFSGRIDGNATPQRIFSGIALTDLVYDETTNRLLCLDVDKIISMKANGEDMYTLPLSTTQTHSGLVAFRDYLVWMTSTTPTKLTFRDVDLLASSSNISFFLPGMAFVTDVVFYDASTQEESESACEVNNGNCNQICVIDGEGRQCLCNFGFHLSSDKVTCVTSYVKTDFFLVVDTLYGKTYQISNMGQVAALGSSQSAVPRHATGYNPATGEIIWFDSQADAIKQLFFNGTSERVILSVKVPTSESRHIVSALCVDYSANTLYFAERKADNRTGWIKVMSLKSHELRTLYTSTTPPRFLSISPQTGKLAFVDDAGEVYLDNMAMDSRMSLKSGLTDISGLVFANNGTSLLWSLEQTDEIVEMSLKTHLETKRLQKSGSYPYSLGVRGSYIYYLTHSQRSIRRLSPEGIETTVAEFPEFGILETLFVEDQDLAKYSTACSTKNGRCSTLCIPGGSNDHRCSCADSVELMDDKKTCRNVQRCMDPVSNGDISVICDRFPEEKCTYTCHEGFSSDHFEIQCGMSGKWVEQVDQLCQPKPSVPAWAIGIASASGMAIIAIVVGCVLYRRLRHFSGHDSAKAGIDLQQPPVIFITDTNSTCAPSHKCISETESVYDELGAIEEDVRYQSFSKISPRYNRRLDRRVTERSGDIALKQSPNGQDDYVELTPDYLEVSGPNKCLPDWIPDADYLTPK